MSRSLYSALFNLYARRIPVDLMEFSAVARQRAHANHLFPEDLSPNALANCTQLPQVRVAVIGAGFAGLAAAWYLRQCGLTPTVYEATGRINGRVETDLTLVAGKTIEAGAELIGANHPMWIELANRFGLTLVPLTTEDEYEQNGLRVRIRFGDHELTEPERQQLQIDLIPVIDSIGQDAKDIDPMQPWLSPNAATFDAMSVSDKLDQILGLQSSLVRTAIEFIVGNDNCATPNTQSYLGLLCQVSAGRTGDDVEGLRGYWEYTETHRCGLGNEQLGNGLGSQITDFRMSSPVTRITISDEDICVFCGDASQESYDYAILAAPPFSWPTIDFPSAVWNPADYTMQHGPAIKHLNVFDRTFWVDNALAPSALWDFLGSVWEGTDQQPSNPPFALSVFSGGQYARSEPTYPPRLLDLFPGYAPTSTRYVDWPSRPFILTGYSVPAPNQVTTVGQNLASPFGGRVFFAGEQTYLGFFGYMEGALQSGARAARDIVGLVCPGTLVSTPDPELVA